MIPTMETHSSRTRILLDLSHTYFSSYRTGIQRVVRSLCTELPKITEELGLDFAAIVLKNDEFVYVDLFEEQERQEPQTHKENVIQHCPNWYLYGAKSICSIIRLNILRRWLLPEPGHLGIFRHTNKIRNVARRVLRRSPEPPRATMQVKFTPRDIIVMPDGYWVMMHIWDAVSQAKAQGAKVAVVVYDLICITHPQFFGPGAQECFTRYLRALNEHADMAIAISRTVEFQLRSKLSQLATDNQRPPKCENFRLGVTVENPDGDVRESVLNLLEDSDKPYLMVSTFEPRKNHKFVLDSFDVLWNRHPKLKLLLIGAIGWMSEEMIQRIHLHPRFGSQLLMINDASDAEVQFCYENCRAVIYPSFVEGFGLPIIEALRNKKTTFASNTSIHREVGKQYCEYFDLSEQNSLVSAVENWERSGCPKPSPTMDRLIVSWNESSRQLVESVLTLSQQNKYLRLSNHAA